MGYFGKTRSVLDKANCRNLYRFWLFRIFPLLLQTSTADLKWGAFPSEKILNRKSNIGTKGTFLHKFYFPTRMRPMQKMHINENNKLSSDHLARAEIKDDSTDYLLCNILICLITTSSSQFDFRVRKFIVSHFKRNVIFFSHFFSHCQIIISVSAGL